MNLNPIDAVIVIGYFTLVFGFSVFMTWRAGRNIESYFLAGRSLPWWLLGMSGSSTFFDITGTMWMVSVFYVLGMRGMWEHWFWTFPFAGFVLAYKAKWSYRSGVLTGMEWMVFRYGAGRAGQAARLVNVIINLLIIVFMLGYAGTGVGKFLEEFLPIDKSLSVPLLFGFTGLYVVLGGFFSVVYSDFLQTVLLSFAAVYIAGAAFMNIDPEVFRQTVGDDWYSLNPLLSFETAPEGYTDPFRLLVILWFTKGLLGLVNMGMGVDFQRFRAARNEAEASKVGFAWGMVISIRWSLVMGFTAYGLAILANHSGAVDSESVLPMVLNQVLPVGIKGLVLAGLLAAFMSTFDSALNVAASFIVNDLVKPVWKSATERQLMLVSYAATLGVVMMGIIISLRTDRIAEIWNPINFALGTALLAPGIMASYWWRISGWAVCISCACTLPVALFVYMYTDLRELQYFPVLATVGFSTCLLASFLCPATPDEALKNFYRRVRPFGFWGPVRKMLSDAGEDPRRPERDKNDIPVAIVGTLFFISLYLSMMDLVLHNWQRLAWLVPAAVITGSFLYVVWWRPLHKVGEQAEEETR